MKDVEAVIDLLCGLWLFVGLETTVLVFWSHFPHWSGFL